MANKIFIVYVEERDGKKAAYSDSIGMGFNYSTWISAHNTHRVYAYPTKKECDETAKNWNRSYIEQGKYLYPVK